MLPRMVTMSQQLDFTSTSKAVQTDAFFIAGDSTMCRETMEYVVTRSQENGERISKRLRQPSEEETPSGFKRRLVTKSPEASAVVVVSKLSKDASQQQKPTENPWKKVGKKRRGK